ncbi:MAG TPA: hypothetical protein PLQ93_10135 [Bacteroidia bacterium]|nr:hypothetical protein [Bacteroidia bacterium]
MALNQNHICEELEGQKCSIVEKNCSEQRAAFLKSLLEHNGFKVVVGKTPSKAPAKAPVEGEQAAQTETSAPELYTVGVSDLSFNTINAIFNRELIDLEGKTVSPAYWKQQEKAESAEGWYWKKA